MLNCIMQRHFRCWLQLYGWWKLDKLELVMMMRNVFLLLIPHLYCVKRRRRNEWTNDVLFKLIKYVSFLHSLYSKECLYK
mmetsp:Transcript_42694/g.64226  ORF Transcript_42694/g.64226 Transcript_42694/m.64226 type:complete len:80 (-) Transcript_42694:84-323(-)